MKINDANKISSSEVIQSQSPGAPPTPKVLTGVASARDVFESAQPSSNLMEALAGAVKQSVSDLNKDKKYFLEKIQHHNNAADALSEELARLAEKSEQLSEMEHGKEEKESSNPFQSRLQSWEQSVANLTANIKYKEEEIRKKKEEIESNAEVLERLQTGTQVISEKATQGAAVKEAFKKDEDPFQLKIVKRD